MPGWLCTKRLCGGRLGQQRAQRLPQHQQCLHRHGGSGSTKSSPRLSPQCHPAHPGLQGWGKGGLLGSGFLWAMPEKRKMCTFFITTYCLPSALQLRLDYFNLYASLHLGITIYGHYFFQN